MKIDKETCIVIAIALAVLVAWGIYYPRQQAEEMKARQRQAMIAQAQAEYAEILRSSAVRKNAPQTMPASAEGVKTAGGKDTPFCVRANTSVQPLR